MAKRKQNKLRAFGEVYNVREKMTEENGLHGEWDDYPNWYEYEMFLQGPDGEIVDEWDSLVETYNGVQRLSKETAEHAVKEIVDDVKAGKAEHWFSHIPRELLAKESKKPRRSARKRPVSKQLSLKGIRR